MRCSGPRSEGPARRGAVHMQPHCAWCKGPPGRQWWSAGVCGEAGVGARTEAGQHAADDAVTLLLGAHLRQLGGGLLRQAASWVRHAWDLYRGPAKLSDAGCTGRATDLQEPCPQLVVVGVHKLVLHGVCVAFQVRSHSQRNTRFLGNAIWPLNPLLGVVVTVSGVQRSQLQGTCTVGAGLTICCLQCDLQPLNGRDVQELGSPCRGPAQRQH